MTKSASEFDLRDFVEKVGAELAAEDQILRKAFAARGCIGGLHRNFNERYFQFIVWRAAVVDWDAKVEIAYQDLVLSDAEDIPSFAVIEMKTYGSANGQREIKPIKGDLAKLIGTSLSVAVMMIFSINPRGSTENNLDLLQADTELHFKERHHFKFETLTTARDEVEFWVAGWLIKDDRYNRDI